MTSVDECLKRCHTQGFPQPPLSSETPSDAMLRAAPLLTMRPSAASKGQLGPELLPVEISERHLALRGGTCTETLVLGKDTSFFFFLSVLQCWQIKFCSLRITSQFLSKETNKTVTQFSPFSFIIPCVDPTLSKMTGSFPCHGIS